MQKSQLRIDQGAVLEREIILLLLGLKSPAEFNQALATEANLGQQIIGDIVREVNERIFIPIREQMRSEAGKAQQPAKPAPPAPSQAGASGQTYAPPPQSPKYFHLENKIPVPPKAMQSTVPVRPTQSSVRPPSPTIAPLPPKVVLPRPTVVPTAPTAPGERSPLRDALAAAMKTKPAESTAKPTAGGKLLEDHEEPHIEFHKTPPAPPPAPPRVAPPPPNLPGAPRPSVAFGEGGIVHPPLTPPAQPSVLVPPPPKPIPPAPPVSPVLPKPYSADPYREPIDEK